MKLIQRLGLLLGLSLGMLLPLHAQAEDRIQWPTGIQPPSQWFNLEQNYSRMALGQFIFDLMTRGVQAFYTNMSVAPGTGLFVTVTPSVANTRSSLYQVGAFDANTFGGPGPPELAADPTLIMLQGMLAAPVSTGPYTPPGTPGQSINFLLEMQVQSVDATGTVVTILTDPTHSTTETVNRDRKDLIVFQLKASAGSVSPAVPVVDAGWVAYASVLVPNGATQVTNPMITLQTQPWSGFAPSGALVGIAAGANVVYTPGAGATPVPTVAVTNAPSFSGPVTASQFNGSGAGLSSGTVPVAALSPLPLAVAQGGTGTSAPSPTATNNATISGTWPNKIHGVSLTPVFTSVNAGTFTGSGSGLTGVPLSALATLPIPVGSGGTGVASLTGSACLGTDATPVVTANTNCVKSLGAATGITIGGTASVPTVGLTVPVATANGGTGTTTPSAGVTNNATISGTFPNYTHGVSLTPTFTSVTAASATLSGLTASQCVQTDGSKVLTSLTCANTASASGTIVFGAVRLQWGSATISSCDGTVEQQVTFANAYSSAPYSITLGVNGGAGVSSADLIATKFDRAVAASFYIFANGGTPAVACTVTWSAIGPA